MCRRRLAETAPGPHTLVLFRGRDPGSDHRLSLDLTRAAERSPDRRTIMMR